jgi:transposase-like protein
VTVACPAQRRFRSAFTITDRGVHDGTKAAFTMSEIRIERAFREIRRRTRPMTCFTNTASCDRIMYAVVHAFNLRQTGEPLSWETTQKT